MDKPALDIVSFDVPYPPNYGGVIDVYHKIRALYELGVEVHLHCYDYGRGRQKELNAICASVNYYKRGSSPFLLMSTKPYVVISRNGKDLLDNLLQSDRPILFEGLHTSYYLDHPALKDRYKMVRMHNIEHHYYDGLAEVEKKPWKKRYFKTEAKKLRSYEPVLKHADWVFAISPEDETYLRDITEHLSLLPVFHTSAKVESLPGRGDFAFYHGNLSVGENNNAALFLVKEVFSELPHNLVIAGNNPSKELREACTEAQNITLYDNLDSDEIARLVREAHINVLPTFQATGIKLKLIIALFKGRFCIANDPMVNNTGLEDLCVRANTAEEWRQAVTKVFTQDFSEEQERAQREQELLASYDNLKNASLIEARLRKGVLQKSQAQSSQILQEPVLAQDRTSPETDPRG